MFKTQTFAHGTLAAALASTLLLSVPAQAGLLGGVSGSVSGAVGASGSVGSSTGSSIGSSVGTSTSIGLGDMNAGAAATGQADARQEAVLTRDEDVIRDNASVKLNVSAQGYVNR